MSKYSSIWDYRHRELQGYVPEHDVGLIRMISAVAGRKLVSEAGEEQASRYGDDYNDGFYVAVFEGGVALAVEYSASTPGYSEYTPGSPARVSYTLYRKPADV